MKKVVIVLAIVALASQAFAVSPDVRISQVYGGGGSATATASYKQDYVELFNASGTDVDISGWAIEYGSATGNWGSSAGNYFVFPAGTWIAGCSYLMISSGTAGTGGADFAITPDFNATMNMSGTNGKVGLFNAVNANLACGSELPGTLVDKMAYGTGNCPEGTAVAVLSISTGAVRNGGGTADTDNNASDFTVVTNPVPNNSQTPATACAPVTVQAESWGTLKSIFR